MSLAFTGEIEYTKYIRSLNSRPLGQPPGCIFNKLSTLDVLNKSEIDSFHFFSLYWRNYVTQIHWIIEFLAPGLASRVYFYNK